MIETNQPNSTELDDDERRHHHRIDKASKMRYQSLQGVADQTTMTVAELCDFSGGGIRFLAPEPLAKNEQLIIELHFNGWQEKDDEWIRTGDANDVGQLNAIGAVMWCSDEDNPPGTYEIGLRFTGRVRQ